MQVFTWSGPFSNYKLAPLIASAEKFSIRIRPILCYGLLDKIRSLKTAINRLPDDETVICLDGYDCLILRPISSSVKQYLAESTKVLFSSQKTDEHHFHANSGNCVSPNQYLTWINSGVIGSLAGTLKHMLAEIENWNFDSLQKEFHNGSAIGNFNDQSLFGRYHQINRNSIAIDGGHVLSKTSVYESLGTPSHDLASESLIDASQEGPSVLHFPFTAQDLYVRYLEIADLVVGRELGPHQIDLYRLKQISNSNLAFSGNANGILKRLRQARNYSVNVARQNCLRYFEKWSRRKQRALKFLYER